MYHPSTFHFQKNEGANERVAAGAIINTKNEMKLRKFPQFCSIFHQFVDHVSTNNKINMTQHAEIGKNCLYKAM